MNRSSRWIFCSLISIVITFSAEAALYNLLKPYDILLRSSLPRVKDAHSRWQIGMLVESAPGSTFAFNSCKDRVNPLQVFHAQENALAMLNGFGSTTPAGSLLDQLNVLPTAPGGLVIPYTCLTLQCAAAARAHYYITNYLSVGIYLPWYSFALRDTLFVNSPDNTASLDIAEIQERLLDNLQAYTIALGQLHIGVPWKRRGVGDLTLLIEGEKDFPQRNRPILTNVYVQGRAGFIIPTGLSANPDLLLAFPFGIAGGGGILLGGGLTVTWCDVLKGGFDVELVHPFGCQSLQRVKTALGQTELLLLQKLCVFQSYGLLQRFTLYTECCNIIKNFSLRLGYEYIKKNEDRLFHAEVDFSNAIINSAISLWEATLHQIVLNAQYHFTSWCGCYEFSASLFARLPFNGVRSLATKTIGAGLEISF